MEAKDPVCGMTVNERNTDFMSSFKGNKYYFCSQQCKTDFDEDPEAVIAMKAERERTTERERSASLEKMIDEVAHEVRNPLTSIGGFARKVYKRMPQHDPNREYMEMIIADVGRLENIIGQLIKLTTVGVSRPGPADINRIINDAVKIFEKEFEEKKIDLKLELMDTPPVLEVERNRIMTAVVNLIKNAIEAFQIPPRTLKISTRARDKNIEIEVSDSGKGIPKDKIGYVFDPLFTSKIYGPGLGLTFVKRIVQDHWGTISVESEPGKGATFTIRLPL